MVFRPEFNGGVYLVIRLTIFGNLSILQCVTSFNMGHVTVFHCEFNSGVYSVSRLTIFGNFSILQYVTSFNMGHVMVFQCEFNGGVYLVSRTRRQRKTELKVQSFKTWTDSWTLSAVKTMVKL